MNNNRAISLAIASGMRSWQDNTAFTASDDELRSFYAAAYADGLAAAAAECLAKHANGNYQYDHRDECATAILALIEK